MNERIKTHKTSTSTSTINNECTQTMFDKNDFFSQCESIQSDAWKERERKKALQRRAHIAPNKWDNLSKAQRLKMKSTQNPKLNNNKHKQSKTKQYSSHFYRTLTTLRYDLNHTQYKRINKCILV